MRVLGILSIVFLGASLVVAEAEDPKAKPAASPPAVAPPAAAPPSQMVLDGQFPGPFKDTLIQRWVDLAVGAICYLYIPVSVPALPRSEQTPADQPRLYGPNGIGSISCIPAQIKKK